MVYIINHGIPIIKRDDGKPQSNGPDTENGLYLSEEVKYFSTDMNCIFTDFILLNQLFMPGLPLVGDSQKFTGQKCMNNSTEKNNRGDQVERNLLDSMFQDGGQSVQTAVMIAAETRREN